MMSQMPQMPMDPDMQRKMAARQMIAQAMMKQPAPMQPAQQMPSGMPMPMMQRMPRG